MILNPGRDVRHRVYGFDGTAQEREREDIELTQAIVRLATARAAKGITVMPVTPEEHAAINRNAALLDPECPALNLLMGATPGEVQAALRPVTALATSYGTVTLRSDDAALSPDVTDLQEQVKRLTLERDKAAAWKEGALHYATGGAPTHNPHVFKTDESGRALRSGWSSGFNFARGADIGGGERDRMRDYQHELHGMIMDALAAAPGTIPDSCQLVVAHMRFLEEQGRGEDAGK